MTLPNDNAILFLGPIEVNQSDCPPSCFTKQAKIRRTGTHGNFT
jgi:hypothetical protein